MIENKTDYPDINLLSETGYYYRILAYNKDGYSFYSNEAFAKTEAKPEEIVSGKAPPTEIIAPVEKPIGQMTVIERQAKITELKAKIVQVQQKIAQLKAMLIEVLKQKIAEIQQKIAELKAQLQAKGVTM